MQNKGLDGFWLKIIALVLMVFDHVYLFFSPLAPIPIWFKWLGRIVFPIFLFNVIQAYTHTRNKNKYMLRLYIAAVSMGAVSFIIAYFLPYGENLLYFNIFGTFLATCVCLRLLDWLIDSVKKRSTEHIALSIAAICMYFSASYLISMNMKITEPVTFYTTHILNILLPTPLLVEGGITCVGLGVLLYLFRQDKKWQLIAFSAASLLMIFNAMPISINTIFFTNYQWMMIFSVPLLYLYNGKKGRGMKYLFYAFYPAHIYILFVISMMLIK